MYINDVRRAVMGGHYMLNVLENGARRGKGSENLDKQ